MFLFVSVNGWTGFAHPSPLLMCGVNECKAVLWEATVIELCVGLLRSVTFRTTGLGALDITYSTSLTTERNTLSIRCHTRASRVLNSQSLTTKNAHHNMTRKVDGSFSAGKNGSPPSKRSSTLTLFERHFHRRSRCLGCLGTLGRVQCGGTGWVLLVDIIDLSLV